MASQGAAALAMVRFRTITLCFLLMLRPLPTRPSPGFTGITVLSDSTSTGMPASGAITIVPLIRMMAGVASPA